MGTAASWPPGAGAQTTPKAPPAAQLYAHASCIFCVHMHLQPHAHHANPCVAHIIITASWLPNFNRISSRCHPPDPSGFVLSTASHSHTGSAFTLASPGSTRNRLWPNPMATCAGWVRGVGAKDLGRALGVLAWARVQLAPRVRVPVLALQSTPTVPPNPPTCMHSTPSSAISLSGLAELFFPPSPYPSSL
jgi:hypothetical protein